MLERQTDLFERQEPRQASENIINGAAEEERMVI